MTGDQILLCGMAAYGAVGFLVACLLVTPNGSVHQAPTTAGEFFINVVYWPVWVALLALVLVALIWETVTGKG